MNQKYTLLGMVAEFDGAIAQISEFVRFLKKHCEHVEVSSLYRYRSELKGKRLTTAIRSSYEDQISVSIKTQISVEPLAFFYSLMAFEREQNNNKFRNSSKVYYLADGDSAFMTPELTLPFDELHLSADLLVPTAEVYGQYFHPILHKTIFEITKSLKLPHGVLFFEQKTKVLET